jgi:hypothetical protein
LQGVAVGNWRSRLLLSVNKSTVGTALVDDYHAASIFVDQGMKARNLQAIKHYPSDATTANIGWQLREFPSQSDRDVQHRFSPFPGCWIVPTKANFHTFEKC